MLILQALSAVFRFLGARGVVIVLLIAALATSSVALYNRSLVVDKLKADVQAKAQEVETERSRKKSLESQVELQNQAVEQIRKDASRLEEKVVAALDEAKKGSAKQKAVSDKVMEATPSSSNDCVAAEQLVNDAIRRNKLSTK